MTDDTKPDHLMDCPTCGVVPHRFQPSPEAGPFYRCSECGEPTTLNLSRRLESEHDDRLRAEERERCAKAAVRLHRSWWDGSVATHALDKADGPAIGQFAAWLRAGGEAP